MGCDIHAHVEIKIEGEWHHYSHPEVDRNYSLFTKIAGVRKNPEARGHIEPIAAPRGIPGDISAVTRLELKRWGSDAHSGTWLARDEVAVVEKQFRDFRPLFGFLFGNRLDDIDEAKTHGVEDCRVVCWFDN
jgi:hypothetical protein